MFIRLATACALLVIVGLVAMFTAARTPVFSVTGNLTTRLAPGADVPLDLVISNQRAYSVRMRGLEVTVAAVHNGSTDPRKQCAVSDFAITQAADVAPMTLSSKSKVSLSSLGVPKAKWPHVRMLQGSRHAQAVCKNARLILAYSAPGWFWPS